MRFTATLEQRTFFSKNLYIEFTELLTDEQVAHLKLQIDTVLAERQKQKMSPLEARYDLWRANEAIKKSILKKTLAEIAAELTKEHFLRIAFDAYFDGQASPLIQPLPLSELSCIKPLAAACLIRLSDDPLPQEIDQSQCPIPSKAGHVVFLSPNHLIHWEQMAALSPLQCLLIAYSPKQAIYHLEKKDPHTHALKRLGYVFGDSLNDTLNPILFRD